MVQYLVTIPEIKCEKSISDMTMEELDLLGKAPSRAKRNYKPHLKKFIIEKARTDGFTFTTSAARTISVSGHTLFGRQDMRAMISKKLGL